MQSFIFKIKIYISFFDQKTKNLFLLKRYKKSNAQIKVIFVLCKV